MKRSDFFTRSGIVCLIGLLLACRGVRAQPEPQPRPLPQKSLQIVSRIPTPQAQSVATDIRWASDDSVFLSWYRDGVAEVGLDGARRRSLIPNAKTFGPQENFSQLAVSQGSLFVAPRNFNIYSRPLVAENGQVQIRQHPLPGAEDLDLRGDRVLVLGISQDAWPPSPGKPYGYDGVVAWLGVMDPDLKELKPLLYDESWPGFPAEDKPGGGTLTFYQCQVASIGAVRFLADGSFVVVPGFQKGVYLFNAQGDRVRAWTSEQVGLDTDCTGVTDEENRKLRLDPAYHLGWLNAHRILDDVLPLPQGPGLLVRSVENGLPSWTLKILTPTRVETYTVPVAGRRPGDRLRGDVRGGKIALLLSASAIGITRDPADLPGEILLAEMPR